VVGVLSFEIFEKNTKLKRARHHTNLVFRVMKFISYTLEHLSEEMFYTSSRTRGGFILMVMLFYSGFVLGLVAWIDAPVSVSSSGVDLCSSGSTCLASIIRLTVWDSNGFDYLFELRHERKFLFALLVIYMCGTAFGILNGLTGIFRWISTRTSKIAFTRNYRLQEKVEKRENQMLIQRHRMIAEIKRDLPLIKSKLEHLECQISNLEQTRSDGSVKHMLKALLSDLIMSLTASTSTINPSPRSRSRSGEESPMQEQSSTGVDHQPPIKDPETHKQREE